LGCGGFGAVELVQHVPWQMTGEGQLGWFRDDFQWC
jgi:hypothetical protein